MMVAEKGSLGSRCELRLLVHSYAANGGWYKVVEIETFGTKR